MIKIFENKGIEVDFMPEVGKDREKSIVIDANSNEKRLKEEKNQLIEIDSKYYETEKLSNHDLDQAKSKLKNEQDRMDTLLNSFNLGFLQKNFETVNSTNQKLDKAKSLITENKGEEAITLLEECKTNLSFIVIKIKEMEEDNLISNLNSKNEIIKQMQDDYAETYSKNQNIKKESVKRNERIKIIDQEIESWKNLLNNSEKMSIELNERKNKQNLKLNELEKQPQTQAEKKGQISEKNLFNFLQITFISLYKSYFFSAS